MRTEVELVEGDLFEPVEGCDFDLIVCNPPYVISPESDIIYRDSGVPGDAFCEALVRRLIDRLATALGIQVAGADLTNPALRCARRQLIG